LPHLPNTKTHKEKEEMKHFAFMLRIGPLVIFTDKICWQKKYNSGKYQWTNAFHQVFPKPKKLK